MAQATKERQALTIAPRYQKPEIFGGTDAAWRVLCDLYPSAETPEVIMALTEYCAAKRLDPFKRPVHIVPMWNAKLRRRVQTIMRGINEIETVASRTGRWAGMDVPQWGPEVERTFRGTVEEQDGNTRKVELTLRFPLWCSVTVYRLVGGERRAFTEQLFWEESYGFSGFRSEVPNERWSKAPRQMLHKCTKAAVLRSAFPEEDVGYAAEEMEDQNTDTGGVTIDGKIDHGDAGLTARDRQASAAYDPAPGAAARGLLALEEPNQTQWLRNLTELLAGAASETELVEIAGNKRVRDALAKSPTLIRQQINDALRAAHERLTPTFEDPPPPDREWSDDPIAELIAEIETMDADALATLPVSAAWRAKTRNLIPPDEDRLQDAIEQRKAALATARRVQP